MQEHPVPHNVLEIEFKLFGNFSIRQFLRIILGCVGALIIYAIGVPALISIPIIILLIALGIASAMIPNFDSRASTLMSAILVSPRYVWRKSPQVPEFLTHNYQQNLINTQTVKTGVNKDKVKVDDMQIEELVQARAERRKILAQAVSDRQATAAGNSPHVNEDIDPLATGNFNNVYDQMFPASASASAQPTQTNSPRAVQPVPTQQSIAVPNLANMNINELQGLLTQLQGKINQLQKQRAPQSEVDQLTAQINSVYQRIVGMSNTANIPLGSYFYGIVVDKKDKPLGGISIQLKDAKGNIVKKVASQADGKFQTDVPLPLGEYLIEVLARGFDKYKIIVSNQRLPAYKLRQH